jgi:hypothetical protein
LVASSVKRTLGHVSQGFQSAGFPDPRLDVDGKTCFHLHQIFRGFEQGDPKKKPQKAIPKTVLKEILRLARATSDPTATAIAESIIGAYLFAMRSCEYSKTCFDEESKRTKILRVRNIRFFLNKRLIQHSDRRILIADWVSITFEWQKSEERHETVSMREARTRSVRILLSRKPPPPYAS